MRARIYPYILLIVGIVLIIYGLSEFSYSSMVSILAIGVGLGLIGIAVMAGFKTEK